MRLTRLPCAQEEEEAERGADAAQEVAPAKSVKGAALGAGRLRRIIADKLLSARKSKVWLLVHADARVWAGLAR